MKDKFYVELEHGDSWERTKWTNPDGENTGRHKPKAVGLAAANKALAEAKKAYPNSTYRVSKAEAH